MRGVEARFCLSSVEFVSHDIVVSEATGDLTIEVPSLAEAGWFGLFSRGRVFTERVGNCDLEEDQTIFAGISATGRLRLGSAAAGLTEEFLLDDLSAVETGIGDIDFLYVRASRLLAGDADRDLDFDQMDLVRVSQAGKYLSGQPADLG